MKFDNFSQNLCGINILDFFYYFLCISSVGKMNISLTKIVVFEPRGFRKKLAFNFLITTFHLAWLF